MYRQWFSDSHCFLRPGCFLFCPFSGSRLPVLFRFLFYFLSCFLSNLCRFLLLRFHFRLWLFFGLICLLCALSFLLPPDDSFSFFFRLRFHILRLLRFYPSCRLICPFRLSLRRRFHFLIFLRRAYCPGGSPDTACSY